MTEHEIRLRNALARIAELASETVTENEDELPGYEEPEEVVEQAANVGCRIKNLPARLIVEAADAAVKINPVNAPVLGAVAAVNLGAVLEPLHIAVLTSKYWGATPRRLTVSFVESTPSNLRARIVSHLNAWNRTSCIEFVETGGTGDVRISRGPGGYWSYLGTDVKLIPTSRPTMNLQGFTMNTPDSEFKRVIRHEAGHTLGFPHEHMRKELVALIDPQKAYQYFLKTQGWDKATVDQQVLTPLDDKSIMGTPADQTSIMCYQLPGSITFNGKPISGGMDINRTDFEFAGKIYPKPQSKKAVQTPAAEFEEWTEEEDVHV